MKQTNPILADSDVTDVGGGPKMGGYGICDNCCRKPAKHMRGRGDFLCDDCVKTGFVE